ncbi:MULTISPECIES: Rdx family protein [Desulfotignum]
MTPKLVAGSNGIYEITAGQTTVFSKRKAKRFPDNQEVIDHLRQLLP